MDDPGENAGKMALRVGFKLAATDLATELKLYDADNATKAAADRQAAEDTMQDHELRRTPRKLSTPTPNGHAGTARSSTGSSSTTAKERSTMSRAPSTPVQHGGGDNSTTPTAPARPAKKKKRPQQQKQQQQQQQHLLWQRPQARRGFDGTRWYGLACTLLGAQHRVQQVQEAPDPDGAGHPRNQPALLPRHVGQ